MLTRLHMLLLLVNQQQKMIFFWKNLLKALCQNGNGDVDGDYEHVCALLTAVLLIPPSLLVRHNTGCCNLAFSKYFLAISGLASLMQIYFEL